MKIGDYKIQLPKGSYISGRDIHRLPSDLEKIADNLKQEEETERIITIILSEDGKNSIIGYYVLDQHKSTKMLNREHHIYCHEIDNY